MNLFAQWLALTSAILKPTLTDGSLSASTKALKLGKMLKYEHVPAFQSALHAPKPL